VIETCTRQLVPNGYLYLGATETLLGLRTRLVPVAGRRGVWRIGQG
jgi:chemotaxis methyl-accepting protein methylase